MILIAQFVPFLSPAWVFFRFFVEGEPHAGFPGLPPVRGVPRDHGDASQGCRRRGCCQCEGEGAFSTITPFGKIRCCGWDLYGTSSLAYTFFRLGQYSARHDTIVIALQNAARGVHLVRGKQELSLSPSFQCRCCRVPYTDVSVLYLERALHIYF